MAYCTHCGNEWKEGARFCEACGRPADALVPVQQSCPAERVLNTPEQEERATSALTWSIVGAALAELGLPGWIVSAKAKKRVRTAMEEGIVGGKLKAARIVSNVGFGFSIGFTIYWGLMILWFAFVIVMAAVMQSR